MTFLLGLACELGCQLEKKKAQPKNWDRIYVLFVRLAEPLSLEVSLLGASEGLLLGDEEGFRIYRSFCNKNSEHQKVAVKENQTSQVNEFSTFLYMGRCKSLGSLKSFFDTHLHYLGPVSVFVFHLESLQSERLRWLTAREPRHPVFTDMAGDILCAQVKLSHSYPYYVFPSSTSIWRVIRQSV